MPLPPAWKPDELQTFITTLDWDQLFGASAFAYKNIRRKADARAYPSRLEFGLKGGIVPPTAINSGQDVELLLGRIAAPYFDMEDFDDLPTPFRTVAVDLLSAQPVVMRSGSLADAMRATMSLPLIFPPIEVNGQVLIDGGTMDNVPADVVKAMGATRVIAVNVGDLADREGISYTMLGVACDTLDAMMRASTRRALGVGGRRHQCAAGAVRIARLATGRRVDRRGVPRGRGDARSTAAAGGERSRIRGVAPRPSGTSPERNAGPRLHRGSRASSNSDTERLDRLLARHVGVPMDVQALEKDIAVVAGLDRYETVTWRMIRDGARGYGLRVRGRAKTYAPPFLMLGLNLENTTSSDFRITTTARYLAFDVVGSGSELRIDGTVGSDPTAATELYRPIGRTPLFVAPYAGIARRTLNVIDDDAVIARYRQTSSRVGLNVGVNLGARSDVRVGAYVGHTKASVTVGDPGFPELSGKESGDRPGVARGQAGQSGCAKQRAALRGAAVAHHQQPRYLGGRRNHRFRRVGDTAVGGGQSVLERRSTQSRVLLRWGRHLVQRGAAADRSVRDGRAVQAQRIEHRRAERAELLRRDWWLPATGWPPAGLLGRIGVRGGLA